MRLSESNTKTANLANESARKTEISRSGLLLQLIWRNASCNLVNQGNQFRNQTHRCSHDIVSPKRLNPNQLVGNFGIFYYQFFWPANNVLIFSLMIRIMNHNARVLSRKIHPLESHTSKHKEFLGPSSYFVSSNGFLSYSVVYL